MRRRAAFLNSPRKSEYAFRSRACDGIGRHARFRFSCRKTWGFESLQAHQQKRVICLPDHAFLNYACPVGQMICAVRITSVRFVLGAKAVLVKIKEQPRSTGAVLLYLYKDLFCPKNAADGRNAQSAYHLPDRAGMIQKRVTGKQITRFCWCA